MRGVRKPIHQSWLTKGLGLLCWGFKGVQKDSVGRGQLSSNRVSSISTRTIHQSTTPSLSQTIWPRWASRQFLSFPIVQTLVPVTFGYSLSSEAVMRDERGFDKGHWHSYKRTSMGPSKSCWNGTSALQPEEITSKGTSFMCGLSIKVPIRKRVWKPF